jgi:hypothetical protein
MNHGSRKLSHHQSYHVHTIYKAKETTLSLWEALGHYEVHMLIYHEQTNITKLLVCKTGALNGANG